MRNWNINSIYPPPITIASFYSTYEELKRAKKSLWTSSSVGFYSTYEELKPYEELRHISCYSRFYSTYEELKLSDASLSQYLFIRFYSTYEELKLLIFIIIVSLNFRFYSTYEELKLKVAGIRNCNGNWFLQYLWGIETSSSIIEIRFVTSVFTVPMRNWNVAT